MCECMRLNESERERECERKRGERANVCLCVCVRERERESACVRERANVRERGVRKIRTGGSRQVSFCAGCEMSVEYLFFFQTFCPKNVKKVLF